MYNTYNSYQCPYCSSTPGYNSGDAYYGYRTYPCPYYPSLPTYNGGFANQFANANNSTAYGFRSDLFQSMENDAVIELRDYGPAPFVVDIEKATKQNNTFRTALWTGSHLQLTLMSIRVGEDIGLEVHPNLDQFIRIEEGEGLVLMGDRKDRLDFQEKVSDDFAFIIPAGKWHNLINTSNKPLKLYSIYAPPQHPKGTVHVTKEEAEAAEMNHGD